METSAPCQKIPSISFFHVVHGQIIIGLKLQNPFLPPKKIHAKSYWVKLVIFKN